MASLFVPNVSLHAIVHVQDELYAEYSFCSVADSLYIHNLIEIMSCRDTFFLLSGTCHKNVWLNEEKSWLCENGLYECDAVALRKERCWWNEIEGKNSVDVII